MHSLKGELDSYNKAIRHLILPFWADQGFLRKQGQFCERLSLTGEQVADVPLRAMVQARQIYVYADAARTGAMPGGGDRACEALDNLLRLYSDDGDLSKGIAFSISCAGVIVSPVRDSYSHAFVLYALASAYRCDPDPKLLRAVDALVSFIDDKLTDHRTGGLLDCFPSPKPVRLQNPMMHMLEAYLALHEAHPDRGFLDRASKIVLLFRERLFQKGVGAIFEEYQADLRAPLATDHRFEPGHQFEWSWLLGWYDDLSGEDHRSFRNRLWQTASVQGLTVEGFCFDQVSVDSSELLETYRLWPHTEGVRAALQRHSGDVEARSVCKKLLEALRTCFLGKPFPEGWMDRLNASHNGVSEMVPASSLYHLYTAYKETSVGVTMELSPRSL